MERGKGKSCTERRVTEKENQIGKDENHLMGDKDQMRFGRFLAEVEAAVPVEGRWLWTLGLGVGSTAEGMPAWRKERTSGMRLRMKEKG